MKDGVTEMLKALGVLVVNHHSLPVTDMAELVATSKPIPAR